MIYNNVLELKGAKSTYKVNAQGALVQTMKIHQYNAKRRKIRST